MNEDEILVISSEAQETGRRIWRRKRRWAWARVIATAVFLIALALWVARVERKISGPPPVDRPSLP